VDLLERRPASGGVERRIVEGARMDALGEQVQGQFAVVGPDRAVPDPHVVRRLGPELAERLGIGLERVDLIEAFREIERELADIVSHI
jgi:hypothetical protein